MLLSHHVGLLGTSWPVAESGAGIIGLQSFLVLLVLWAIQLNLVFSVWGLMWVFAFLFFWFSVDVERSARNHL